MKVMICVDDKGGIAFNKRRQSQDRVLTEYILNMIGTHSLYMNSYSRKIFPEDERIMVSEQFLDEAGEGDYCFAEGMMLTPYMDRIEEVIVFRWNRHYPSDKKLDIDVTAMEKIAEEEFVGYSHEKITMEEYRR